MSVLSASTPDRFVRHRGPVTGVAALSGTDVLVTSAYDGAVGVFDLRSREVGLLGYHDHLVNRVVTEADGPRAATCGSDYTVQVWDVAGRRLQQVLRGHSDDVEDFVFAGPDTGVSASRDRRILVWDLQTGAVRRVLEGHDKDVLALAYHQGRIYSAGDDRTLRVWNLETGEMLSTWGPFDNETDTCAIDPLHGRAVLGCDDGCIRVFDISDGRLLHEVPAHRSGIKKVAVSPANGDILSSAYDQRLVIWDAETMQEKLVLDKFPTTWERSLTWSPDGSRILGGTFDGTVLVWDARKGTLETQVGEQGVSPGNACLNDVGATASGEIALVSDDGFVRLGVLTPERAELLAVTEPGSGRILMNAVTLDEEYGMVAAGAHDNRLHLFRIDGGRLVDEVEAPLGEGPINSVRIARHPGHERETFVACYSGAIVRVGADGAVRGTIHVHEGAVKALRLHPERRVGVSCGADGLLLSWSFDGELREHYRGHMAIINDVDLSPRGDRLASVSRDFSMKVFDVESGRLHHSVGIGRKSLKSVLFWDDETVVVGDYWGGLIRVDLATERVVRRVVARNGISAVARAGAHLVAVSYDGTAYLVRPGDLEVVNRLGMMRQRLDGDAPARGS
jgi:WD40 repeat protein